MTYYVWGGTLRGVEVEASSPREAVVEAILAEGDCVLHRAVRVSLVARGLDRLDETFLIESEEQFLQDFPELRDHPEVAVAFHPVSELLQDP